MCWSMSTYHLFLMQIVQLIHYLLLNLEVNATIIRTPGYLNSHSSDPDERHK